MKNNQVPHPLTRREFFNRSGQGLGLLALSQFAPAFITQSTLRGAPKPERDRSILVLVQLAGGNDGLNTVIPHEDDRYHKMRPKLREVAREALPIGNDFALHPSCGAMKNLYDEGELAIIQNVGYPNPNRSHFRSMEIWETASDSDEYASSGWLGRYLDNECGGAPAEDPAAIHLSPEVPQAFHANEPKRIFGIPTRGRGRRYGNMTASGDKDLLADLAAFDAVGGDNAHFLSQTLMDALVTEDRVAQMVRRYRTEVSYPGQPLAQSLKQVAAMISAGLETRVYFVSLGGFDTHVGQIAKHAQLMTQLSGALEAFQRDLNSKGLQDQVLTMTFSEFGRRPHENNGAGTDHGTAAPLFMMGSQLKERFIGQAPNLELERGQDLEYQIDFRQVYATVLDGWLGCDADSVLSGKFGRLPVI